MSVFNFGCQLASFIAWSISAFSGKRLSAFFE